jgi:hypothetical protein
MALREGERYTGVVVEGSKLFQSNSKKTPGFQVQLELETGGPFKEPTDYIIWLTPKNKARAERDFETLGIQPEKLRSRSFVEFELAQAVVGAAIECELKAETYNNQTKLKVNWIAPLGATNETELVGAFVGVFGGDSAAPPSPPPPSFGGPPPPGEDDDIPF